MINEGVVTLNQSDVSSFDGGGYVHRSKKSQSAVEAPIASLKKQISADQLKCMLSSGSAKVELSSLERYRMEVDACKSKKERRGFFKKAMSSVRHVHETIENDHGGTGSPAFEVDSMPLKSHSAREFSDAETVGLHPENNAAFGLFQSRNMARSSSNNSIPRLENLKYMMMIKKAVRMMTVTSLLTAGGKLNEQRRHQEQNVVPVNEKTDEETEDSFSRRHDPKIADVISKLNHSQEKQNIGLHSLSRGNVTMTVEDLMELIFRSPDSMTIGDLKHHILKHQQVHPSETHPEGLRSSSHNNRRSRSNSRTSRRQVRECTELTSTCEQVQNKSDRDMKRSRRSLGQRQGSTHTNTLSASGEYSFTKKNRRGRRRSFDDDDSTLYTENDLSHEETVDDLREAIFAQQGHRPRSRERSRSGSIDTSSTPFLGGQDNRGKRKHNRGSRGAAEKGKARSRSRDNMMREKRSLT
jgi:hypothetical protein